MGPVIILDKSAFQSLSRDECLLLERYFLQALPPILAVEIFGDLGKKRKADKAPQEKVRELAGKFLGSGPTVCTDFRSACLGNLEGHAVPMDGRILVSHGQEYRTRSGGRGLYLDLHPLNRTILHWQDGGFSDEELQLAAEWRGLTRGFTGEAFREILDKRYIIVPRVATPAGIRAAVDNLLNSSGLQDEWFFWLLGQLRPRNPVASAIENRWRHRPRVLMRDHAPYAHHCLRAMLTLHVAVRSGLVAWKTSNWNDLQYLFYLPFCMVFCSNDALHRTLVPAVMRDDQSFVWGEDLKTDLARTGSRWGRMTDFEKRKMNYAFGSHPIPVTDSVVFELWRRHMPPWRAPSGNLATELVGADCEAAIREAEALYEPFRKDGPADGLPTERCEDRRPFRDAGGEGNAGT